MNEKKMKQYLLAGILFCVVTGVVVVTAGVFSLRKLKHSLSDLINEQMQAETIDYSGRIIRQIDKDFQTLNTLAAFIEGLEIEPDFKLADILNEANLNNEFVTMGYFDENGIGSMAHLEHGIRENVDYRDLGEQARKSIDLAYQGQPNMSELFESQISSMLIFIYCVPIMENGNVKAVLAASDNVDIFDISLDEEAILNGNGSIHLLDGNGNVLLSSDRLEKGQKIFSRTYFLENDLTKIKQIEDGSEGYEFLTLKLSKRNYPACMKALGINHWILLCVHDSATANRTAASIIETITAMACILLVILLSLLLFTSGIILKSREYFMQLAYQDRLTGADNMLRFERNLAAAREHDKKYCIAALNIRQFKFINEVFGAEEADRLLRAVSREIGSAIQTDEFFARESADLFYLYLRQAEENEVKRRLGRLIHDICTREHSGEHDFQLRMYVGAYIHEETENPRISNEMLMTRVSFAAESCKERSLDWIQFYDETVHKEEEMENYVDSRMEQALSAGEFHVFLQPKIDLKKNKLGGAEALVRWFSKDKGIIYPDAFIPQFEKNGFCVRLDLYMVEQVCRLLRSWLDAGIEPIPISVNQSKLLFFQTDYLSRLQSLLDRYQIPAELITLEILEGLALEHADEMNEKLRSLRAMGFRISMDDFGSGYSSFNTLGNLEIDELKLDRGFLLEISKGKSARFYTIMSSIMALSKNLHILTVTEGVETKEDEELIRSLGCDYGQGYLYSRPISAEEFQRVYMEA